MGEGGAGTFSDGKLNTLIKDPDGRIRYVLETFAQAGAGSEILWEQKPHIGTDVLINVVKNLREEILALGGIFLFESCLTGLAPLENGSWLLEINHGESSLTAGHVILAVGHSARDTLRMLYKRKLKMEPKSFAVGLRAEHPQSWINEAMYGKDCPYELGAAPYKVTHKCSDGRGVYSFCMCPGGYVVNASSQEGRLAVNGMSYHDRTGENANSAIVVTVSPQDYGGEGPLAGMLFQERLEETAFALGKGKIPLQRFEDFCEGRITTELGKIMPQTKGAYSFANLRSLLPEELNLDLIEGMRAFEKRNPRLFGSGYTSVRGWKAAPPLRCGSAGMRTAGEALRESIPAGKIDIRIERRLFAEICGRMNDVAAQQGRMIYAVQSSRPQTVRFASAACQQAHVWGLSGVPPARAVRKQPLANKFAQQGRMIYGCSAQQAPDRPLRVRRLPAGSCLGLVGRSARQSCQETALSK